MLWRIKIFVKQMFMRLCWVLQIQNKVVLSSWNGAFFNDNPQCIFKELKKICPKTKMIWMLQNENVKIEGAEVVQIYSLKALYHLATARVWIDNIRKPWWMIKRKGQYYVQTWHGDVSGGKKIEKDVENLLTVEYLKCAKHDSEMADLLLAGSEWFENLIRRAFWYDGKILKVGVPKYDVIFCESSDCKKKVKQFYGIDEKTKILLYVPTFRNAHNTECYNIDWNRLLVTLRQKFGTEWKILLRLHPNVIDKVGVVKYNENIINGNLYANVDELVVASDIVISDYSGMMGEAALTKKPVFLYMSDYDDYVKERDLYFQLHDMPYMIAKNNDELNDNISKYDHDVYMRKVNDFFDNCGIIRNSHASYDVAIYIAKNFIGCEM